MGAAVPMFNDVFYFAADVNTYFYLVTSKILYLYIECSFIYFFILAVDAKDIMSYIQIINRAIGPALIRRINMRTIKLYHGTSTEAAEAIKASGKLEGPAFFTPRRDIASDFGEEVLEVTVPVNLIKIDFDLPGRKLLSVEDANEYEEKEFSLDDWLDAGQSVGVECDIEI